MSENLCRGWPAGKIRTFKHRANEKGAAVLDEMARHYGIALDEIAENLGMRDWHEANGAMQALGKLAKEMGVKEPGTDRISWPFYIEEVRVKGEHCRYYMPPEVSEVVRAC